MQSKFGSASRATELTLQKTAHTRGYLNDQEVSDTLKVPKPTLRFWEKDLDGIFVPFRTDGRQRRYTVENIAVIEEIKKLKKKGMSLPEIKRKLGKGQMSEAGLRPIGAYPPAWKLYGLEAAPVGSQACPPSRATLNILYSFVDSLRRGGRACPQRSRLRGGRGAGDKRTDRIDLLAARVAEVVRAEVNRFFEGVGTELD